MEKEKNILKIEDIQHYPLGENGLKCNVIGENDEEVEYEETTIPKIFNIVGSFLDSNGERTVSLLDDDGIEDAYIGDVIPFLRPMDLTEEIEVDGKKYIPAEYLWAWSVKDQDDYELYGTIPEHWTELLKIPVDHWNHKDVMYLYKNKFDVKDLIGRKLAKPLIE